MAVSGDLFISLMRWSELLTVSAHLFPLGPNNRLLLHQSEPGLSIPTSIIQQESLNPSNRFPRLLGRLGCVGDATLDHVRRRKSAQQYHLR